MDHFQSALDWLVLLHAKPGWTEHVWLRAMRLDDQELYAGMWASLESKVGPAPASAVAYRQKVRR